MQNKNHRYRNFRFKLFAVLCAIAVLSSAFFVSRPALARPATADNARALAAPGDYPGDKDYSFSAISRGANKLDIFVIRKSGEIWMRSYNGNWGNWSNFGKAPTGEKFYTISAVAAGNNRWDIFATSIVAAGSPNNVVWHTYFDGYATFGWEGLGSVGNAASSGIQAVSTGNGRIDLFTRDTSTSSGATPALWKVRLSNGAWSPGQTANWSSLDTTTAASTFSALAHSGNRIDLFRRVDSDQTIRRKYYTGTTWGPVNPFTHLSLNMWQDLSGQALYTPYAVSWGTNRIDVFVRGIDNNVYINNTDNAGASWNGWGYLGRSSLPTVDVFAVSAVSWGPNRLDLFTEEGPSLFYKSWNGTNWWPSQTDWENLGTIPAGGFVYGYPPLPVSWGPNRIDLFAYDFASDRLFHKWTNGSGWEPATGGFQGWENLGPG